MYRYFEVLYWQMGCVTLWEWCHNEIILKNMIFLSTVT